MGGERWAGKVQGTPELLWLIWMFELRGGWGGLQRGKFSVLLVDEQENLIRFVHPPPPFIIDGLFLVLWISFVHRETVELSRSNFSFQIVFFWGGGKRIIQRCAANTCHFDGNQKGKGNLCSNSVWLVDTNFI